ncbi:hypothetical protein [Aeromicrobium sp. CTD01-1L150]
MDPLEIIGEAWLQITAASAICLTAVVSGIIMLRTTRAQDAE